MGVEPYLIASAFRGALAQRLVRKVCAACRRPVEPTPQELAQLKRELGETGAPIFYRGAGCTECKQTGFRGRTAILELLLVDEALREFIVRRASRIGDPRSHGQTGPLAAAIRLAQGRAGNHHSRRGAAGDACGRFGGIVFSCVKWVDQVYTTQRGPTERITRYNDAAYCGHASLRK